MPNLSALLRNAQSRPRRTESKETIDRSINRVKMLSARPRIELSRPFERGSVMVRTVGSSGPRTMEAISEAGLDLIYRHGYEGMSLRQLAAVVGIQQGSLYNYFRSKQDLLAHLYEEHMGHLLLALDAALTDVSTPRAQLAAFVAFHVGYHIDRKREVFVVNSELRSLERGNRDRATAFRRTYEGRLIAILQAGAAEEQFQIADAPVTAFGILGLLSGICTWFDSRGRLDREAICGIYTDLVLRSVSAPTRPLG